VVPILYQGPLLPNTVEDVMAELEAEYDLLGEAIPEGVVIYYIETGTYAKATFTAPEGKWKLNN